MGNKEILRPPFATQSPLLAKKTISLLCSGERTWPLKETRIAVAAEVTKTKPSLRSSMRYYSLWFASSRFGNHSFLMDTFRFEGEFVGALCFLQSDWQPSLLTVVQQHEGPVSSSKQGR